MFILGGIYGHNEVLVVPGNVCVQVTDRTAGPFSTNMTQ